MAKIFRRITPRRIYLDYASQTPLDRRVLREISAYSGSQYANPSSIYKEGVAARKAVDSARARIGALIHGHGDEIVFTSGGTEANGLALEAAGRTARRNGIAKPHLIISEVEHSSVMATADMLEKHGVEVTRLGVDPRGLVSVDELKKAIKPSTYLVSIMTVNNEIGTVQPIREIAKMIRHAKKAFKEACASSNAGTADSNEGEIDSNKRNFGYPLFHTDAAQSALHEGLNVEQLGVDLMTLDSSKIYGPRGIGALFVRRGTLIEPIIYGGGQERGLRSGTENVPAIMGFAKAFEIAADERNNEVERVSRLRDYFLAGLRKIRPDLKVNPPVLDVSPRRYTQEDITSQSPHILNVSIPGIDNEVFILRLDAKGVAASTKSSCLRDAEESYVLKAIGADSRTSVRFSFGRATKKADLDTALSVIAKALKV